MTDLIMFGVNLLLIMFSWRFVFKPVWLDYVRGKLFDRREILREHYLKKNDLDNPVYLYARNMYNHDIRFIEGRSLLATLYMERRFSENKSLVNYVRREIEKQLKGSSEEDLEVLKKHREMAGFWVNLYLIHSSVVWLFVFYAAFLTWLVCFSLKSLTLRLCRLFMRAGEIVVGPTYQSIKAEFKAEIRKKLNHEAIEAIPVKGEAPLSECKGLMPA